MLPQAEHLAGLLHERSFFLSFVFRHAFGHESLDLVGITLAEQHIEIADEVVAFLSGRFGCGAFAPELPCEHRLADMDAAIVHDIGFHHAVAASLEDAGEGVAKQVVADMAKVEGFVGIGR